MNERGQGLSVSTLVLIVLGVLILVILILGFTIGWSKIFPFISPPNNVQSVVDACALACNTNSKFDYCSQTRELRIKDGIPKLDKTEVEGTCYDFTLISGLGVRGCSSFTCEGYSSEEFRALVPSSENNEAPAADNGIGQ